ncbi:hypothetical protein BKA66DRAFT_473698 [Pyrenochaeta sp. MPI-SDFR-AT-0127]|nr:hypothetical protein BKA66DRAFT_473698 [Pyrenochaeta sp. MPI-SDFR-AT-0127]
MEIFDCIMLNYEINNAHADHVVNALERIGTRCKRLLVIAPIHTSELGNVFNREMGNIDPGNDWNHILRCFPNLKCLIFVHPLNEPEEISRATYLALRSAITRRQATHDINGFGYVGAPRVLTCFAHNTTNSTTSTITITRL